MQLPATSLAVALPLMTNVEADRALLSTWLWSPEVYVPLGTWVMGFEHCAVRAAARTLQAQNQSAGRTRIFVTPRDFDAALISRSLIWLPLASRSRPSPAARGGRGVPDSGLPGDCSVHPPGSCATC